MHMADALVSPPVAVGAAAISLTLIGIAASKVRKDSRENIVPLMGVLGAFIFAAQMINFSIPGTGSSGHIIGGVLLAAILGPWAAYLTLASVLVVQCLVFADGGLMALGCNLLNMGVCTALVAYPLVYRPTAGQSQAGWRIVTAAILACVAGLELGALLVTVETEMSGVTVLPFREFLGVMGSIHLFIGLGEGLATAAVLGFVRQYQPSLLDEYRAGHHEKVHNYKRALWIFGGLALVLGGCFAWIASSYPDGLEWSIAKVTGLEELPGAATGIARGIAEVQSTTSVLPDYSSTWSGIIGCMVVLTLVWVTCALINSRRKKVHCRE